MPETTPNYHHIPVAKKKKGNPLRTITLGKGVKALYDYKRKVIVTYLFDVDQYTMKQAKEWVKKHKSSAALLQSAHNQYLSGEFDDYIEDVINIVNEKLNQ
jgi:hypothetical protein